MTKNNWIIYGFILFGIILVIALLNLDLEYKGVVKETINFSKISSEYDLENLTYKAVDYQGNEISGESYYGVDGVYTKEKPLIQGEHYYTYWVKNDSYYIEPVELIIDENHRNQSIIAKAYKKVNLSNDIKVVDVNNYLYDEISFVQKDEYFDVAEFDIKYYSKERTRFPFGAIIVFEYDKQIDDFVCYTIFEVRFPNFYSMNNVDNRGDAFEIERDKGEWERIEIYCVVEKYFEKELTNNKIKISIYPKDFFLIDWDFTEEYELRLGIEDYLTYPLNKPIFEGEIIIK